MRHPAVSLQRSTEALAQAQSHWSRRGQFARRFPGQSGGFTIALTRQAGVPGTTIGTEVGQRLGWPVYDHELVEKIAQELGLRVELLDSIDEKHRGWLAEAVEQFVAVPSVSERTYARHLVETILSLGTHGECVIVEHGAAQILPLPTTLRVRLVARLEDRIEQISRRFHVHGQEALRKLQEIDHERARFIHESFQKDLTDATAYDLLLNTSRWSVGECAELIADGLRRLQEQAAAKSG